MTASAANTIESPATRRLTELPALDAFPGLSSSLGSDCAVVLFLSSLRHGGQTVPPDHHEMATRTAAKTKVAVKPDVKPSVGPSTSVRGATGSSSRSNGGRPSSLQATKETANMADFYLGQTSNAVELSSDESDFGNEIQADIEEEKDYKAKRQQGTGRGRGRRPEFRSRVVKVEDGKQKADSEAERTKKAKQWKKKPSRCDSISWNDGMLSPSRAQIGRPR